MLQHTRFYGLSFNTKRHANAQSRGGYGLDSPTIAGEGTRTLAQRFTVRGIIVQYRLALNDIRNRVVRSLRMSCILKRNIATRRSVGRCLDKQWDRQS